MGFKLGEFFVDLVTKVDTYKVKDFAKTIGELPLSIAAGLAALGGMELGFMALTSSTLEMGTQLRLFKAMTGESTDELEKWQMVARRVGLTNEAATGSISKMVGAIAQLKTFGTGPAAEMFGRLGITGVMQKSPGQLLAELREKYRQLDPRERSNFAQVAGNLIDPNMMLMFSSKWSSPESMAKMNPMLGASGMDATRELTEALSVLTDTLRSAFIDVFKKIEPDMKEIAEDLGYLVRFFGSVVHANLQGLAGIKASVRARGWGGTYENILDAFLPLDANKNLWKPGKSAGVVVHQNFYGHVDKDDIDAGRLDLEHSLVHASRMLNRGGR